MPPSPVQREPVLKYTNWAEWNTYWHDHLVAHGLWQYTDPDTGTEPPQPTTTLNQKIYDRVTENYSKIRLHVSEECRGLLAGHTTLRSLWAALKAGTDRGTTIPLLDKVRKFHNNKWESKDTISSYTSRLRDLYLSLENTPQVINRDLAVHILIDGLPDCYQSIGHAAQQQNLPFIETTAYLLANIKDSTTAGDNSTGQALYTRGRQSSRKSDARQTDRGSKSRSSRGRGRGGRGFRRSPYPKRDSFCGWCRKHGHLERECRLRQQQLDSGAASRDRSGRVYLAVQPQQQMTLSLPAQHHTAQAQYQSPQYPHSSDSGQLLIARAAYTSSRTQEKDTLSWILDSGSLILALRIIIRMTCRTSRSINVSVRLKKSI
jgi:gag-polypeptide of LTR copia-type